MTAPLRQLPEALRPRERMAPLLFGEFPRLAETVPWLPLAHTPTAVERCDALADWLGRDDVWMKRDDLISPLYGGNKVRRYEFVLADALARGATRLFTVGGLASTQVTATALFGRALGLDVRAVLYDQPVTAFLRDALLAGSSSGAELIYGGNYVTTAWRAVQAWRRDRSDSYVIAPGASGPVATLGYVDMMLELAEQVAAGAMPRPDLIVVPSGSTGTLAALAVGAAYLGWPTETVGIRIAPRIATNDLTVRLVASGIRRFLVGRGGVSADRLAHPRWRIVHDAYGGGYGRPTAAAIEGVARWRTLTGVSGEVTYSGKELVGLRAVARDPRHRGKVILMLNTLSHASPAVAADAASRLPRAFAKVFAGPVPV